MRILILLIVSAMGLLLSGCAEQPLMSDEEYYAKRGPAPNSPDFSSVLPHPSSRGTSGY